MSDTHNNSLIPTAQDQPSDHSQFGLLRQRRFAPLFLTQFLGAFNDNAYKNCLVVLLTFNIGSWTDMRAEILTNLAAGLFMLPFFLFSSTAGQIADKYDKAQIARWVKILEILIVVLAGLGFWMHSLAVLLTALFLLGFQASLFGPVKYALLPQHLKANELVGANAIVEAGTFVGILLGTLIGGILAAVHFGTLWIIVICMVVAVSGYVSSLYIPAAAAPMPGLKISLNPFAEAFHCIGFALKERMVFHSIIAISWFWLFGAILLAQFPLYTKKILGGNESVVTLLLAVFCFGIGLGSLMCEKFTKLAGKSVEPALVPIGALGMAVFGIDLAFASPTPTEGLELNILQMFSHAPYWRVLIDLFLLSGFGGLYCVPLYAIMQQRSDEKYRARIIASNNIINAMFMVGGAIFAGLFLGYTNAGVPDLFLAVALMHTVVTLYIFKVIPEPLIKVRKWLKI